MNDIRFLNELGDNLEEAARRNLDKQPGRRRPRRRLFIGLAVIAATATGIAAASQIFSSPDSLAANSIGCYESRDLSGNVAILSADGEPPVKVCARVRSEDLKLPPTKLVACAKGEVVVVFPGKDCSEAGLNRLPDDYRLAVEKHQRLALAIGEIEASADCVAPQQLADRAQEVFQRQGWDGWTAELRGDESLPCGQISAPDGDGGRTLTGALNTADSTFYVFRSFPRAIEEELESRESPVNEAITASGGRCHTAAEVAKIARKELEADRFTVALSPTAERPQGMSFGDSREARYRRGCAVIGDILVSPDEAGNPEFDVKIYQDRG